jgi:hypothetical protein
MECKNKGDNNNDKGNWHHSEIFAKIPEQHAGKTRIQGNTENSHIGHCTCTAECTNIKV